jgi:hypothetical protein
LFKWIFRGDHVELSIEWRENPLLVRVYLFACKKTCKDLDSEVETRRLVDTCAQAIIPVTSIASIHQILQGAIYYSLYASKQRRFRNRGLLLAALILGTTQIEELTKLLENTFEASNEYYLVGVDCKLDSLEGCYPLELRSLLEKPPTMHALVKNALVPLSLT